LNGVRVISQMAADPAGRWADTAAAPLIQRGNRDAKKACYIGGVHRGAGFISIF
jgi:hypothetical protein